MRYRIPFVKAIVALSATLWLLSVLFTVVGGVAMPSRRIDSSPTSALLNSPVFSDFDSDRKLDRAELSSNGRTKTISIELGKAAWKTLVFDSKVTESGQLISGDIDGDGDIDLIWFAENDPTRFVVWLNDGYGEFSMASPKEPNAGRFQALLQGTSKTGLAADSSESQLIYIPQTGSFTGFPENVSQHLPVFTRGLLPQTRAPMLRATSYFIHQERGPPSQHS